MSNRPASQPEDRHKQWRISLKILFKFKKSLGACSQRNDLYWTSLVTNILPSSIFSLHNFSTRNILLINISFTTMTPSSMAGQSCLKARTFVLGRVNKTEMLIKTLIRFLAASCKEQHLKRKQLNSLSVQCLQK